MKIIDNAIKVAAAAGFTFLLISGFHSENEEYLASNTNVKPAVIVVLNDVDVHSTPKI